MMQYFFFFTLLFPALLSGNIFLGIGRALLTNNFHVIQNGIAYRSGTMSAKNLAQKIRKYGIKSVVNLRGKQTNQKWWIEESTLLKKYGISFYNVKMSAHMLPPRAHILELIHLFHTAKRPLLIHCHAGADRTSQAAALWKRIIESCDTRTALRQLSSSFGHIKRRYPAMEYFLRLLPEKGAEAWIKKYYYPENHPSVGVSLP